MPATARWSASTAWSPLPGDTTRPNSLSGPTFGPSARVRAPCYGPENTAAAGRHAGRAATRPAGERGQAKRARQWPEYHHCQRTRHHRFGTRAGQWNRRVRRYHTPAKTNTASAAQALASALVRRYWCRLATHRVGTVIACERSATSSSAAMHRRRALLGSRARFRSARQRHIAAFRVPGAARESQQQRRGRHC